MISLEQIAHQCDKVRWQGKDSFTACCVAHDDRNPSMSVTERDGTILVHCHSGCPQDAVLEALGMTKRRDTTFTPRRTERPKEHRKPATLAYAKELWERCKRDDQWVARHPYAKKKRIGHAFGAGRYPVTGSLVGHEADCLIIPNRDWGGNLIGVECINAEGKKQTFGSKGMLLLGHPEGAELIHVCEGWATAWALGELFPDQFACIVAFGKSAMETIANAAQIRFKGKIAVHEEGKDNRDVWDVWNAGEGESYANRVRRAAHV
jgi:phage/plasmid primase-like uncharacterized protein